MRRTTYGVLGTALTALLGATPALAGPPPQSTHYEGIATITNESNDLLVNDGNSTYGAPSNGVFVKDNLERGGNDLFGLYVSRKHTFTLTFDGNSFTCGGVSHVFFEGAGWWEATDDVNETALGTASIWCDQGDNTAYAVRYPATTRPPGYPGDPCVGATRLADVDGGRQYRFATPDPVANEEEGGLLPLPVPGGGSSAQEAAAACPARIFHVKNVNNNQRSSDQIGDGRAAAFEVSVTLEAPRTRGGRE